MPKLLDKIITYSFYALFFTIPLIVYPFTSELFEFNKIIVTYGLTATIFVSWLAKMVLKKRVIFKRTPLDIPLFLFFSSQLISTLVSVDPHTSFFGYYSRFHGGLLSTITYLTLYWAYLANMDRKKTIKSIKFIFASSFFVSTWGILEHFGIDADIWVQNVQERVFSTLGQPNWLAAWLVALIPLIWAFYLHFSKNTKRKFVYLLLFTLTFFALLFTKSRSGIIGFSVAFFIYWFFSFIRGVRKTTKLFTVFAVFVFLITLIVGTPWTPSISEKVSPPNKQVEKSDKAVPPALELGGTSSVEIRKIVWQGAVDIWKHYPVFGTGVETFAYSYYNFRPKEHNLVSEWDYLYNKAHNEYLNFAATTGTYGLSTYLLFIIAVILFFSLKADIFNLSKQRYHKPLTKLLPDINFSQKTKDKQINLAFLSGFVSILVTNFFGFSVVPVATLFFVFPAMAIAMEKDKVEVSENLTKINGVQILGLALLFSLLAYTFLLLGRYWYADYLYAHGEAENEAQNLQRARELLTQATKLNPNQSIFWIELGEATAKTSVALQETENEELAQKAAQLTQQETQKALTLSPADVNIKRRAASVYIDLSKMDINYLVQARQTLIDAVKLAPTDAKLLYNLGLAYIRTGERDLAMQTLENAVEVKSDYRNARYAVALLSIDAKDYKKAEYQLNYILENIAPNDEAVKRELEELQTK